MLDFLSQNWGSILVALIVLALCGLAVWRLFVGRKRGKSCGCGGDCGICGGCRNSGERHGKNKKI